MNEQRTLTPEQAKENQLHLAFEWLRKQAEQADEAFLLLEEIIRLRTLEKQNEK